MSYTELFRFTKDGAAKLHATISNGWDGSVAIWQILEQRYLPPYIPPYVTTKPWYTPGMSRDYLKMRLGYTPSRIGPSIGNTAREIFDLAHDDQVTVSDRIVLMTTMDDMLVTRENIPRVIEAFKSFGGKTNLPVQWRCLDRLMGLDDWIAVGWNHSTICAKDWGSRGGYVEETETYLPYNCLTMNEHIWLFEELEASAPHTGGVP